MLTPQPKQSQQPKQPDFSAFGTMLADVEEKELRWLWKGYLASAKLNGLEGDADKGKSLIMLDIAARVSRGWPMPCAPEDAVAQARRPQVRAPGNVILLCAEDDIADTVKPRLRAAGADFTHIAIMEDFTDADGTRRGINLVNPAARDHLLAAIRQLDAKLLIIDPLAAFMGKSGDADMNKEQDMRDVLKAFQRRLMTTDCAVWAIRHRGKDRTREPVHRALGSTAITALFRSEWGVDVNPSDTDKRVFSAVKANLVRKTIALDYYIDDDGSDDPQPFIVWEGTSIWDAKSLAREVETFDPRLYIKRLLDTNGEMELHDLQRLIKDDSEYTASKKPEAIRFLLHSMSANGEIVNASRGHYKLPEHHQTVDWQPAA